jgi:signal peptidase I
VVITTVVDVVILAMTAALGLLQNGAANLVGGVGELFMTFLILRHLFRLSTKQTFAPFVSMFLWMAVEFGLMLGIWRPFVGEAFVLPTESMSPTLVPGNYFVVNKLAHPVRWDLVVYHSGQPQNTVWSKRIVAFPGERLRFDGGDIFINDQRMTVPPVVAGRYHAALPNYAGSLYRDGQTITLGDRQFFVVGDNVDRSGDSRVYGPSDVSSLIGVIDFVYWPVGHARIVRY